MIDRLRMLFAHRGRIYSNCLTDAVPRQTAWVRTRSNLRDTFR